MTEVADVSNYRASYGSLNATEWAQKFYGLQRNYESMSRICKEKCKRNAELEGEISGLFEKNEKYDALQDSNKQYLHQNAKLYQENSSLQDSVKDLEKKLNELENKLHESKKTLKQKSIIHIELEDMIQCLKQSKSELQQQNLTNLQTTKDLNAKTQNLRTKLKQLQNEQNDLKNNLSGTEVANQALRTSIIQKDNIILSKDNQIKKLNDAINESKHDYQALINKHNLLTIKHDQMEIECKNYKMDIDIFSNRLKHYEKNEDNENENKMADKIKNLRDMISELESQQKYNLHTIDKLTKIKLQSIQNDERYNELKQKYDAIKGEHKQMQSKYADLQTNYACNNEQLQSVTNEYEQLQIEHIAMKQSVNDKDIEIEQISKQYLALNNSYTDLQHQYSAYLHMRNNKEMSELELKKISERHGLLKNDVQRLLLENEEWMKKYDDLSKNYDALNDEFVFTKNHSMQLDALMNETKQCNQKNLEQIKHAKDAKINELNKEIKKLNDRVIDAENDNIVLKNKPTLSISEYTMLCDKESQLMDIVNKMYVADQSIEPSFKCTICNDLFVDPITCQPCGHSFCRKCIKKAKDVCNECRIKIKYFQNEILENLTNKFKMRMKTYLPALQQIANRKTNVTGISSVC